MDENRTPTGVKGLDVNLQGGFPKGSMILLTGKPGTGKTMFSTEFLYNGANEHSENGIYISFSEGRSTFMNNMSKFGKDLVELEEQGKLELLDLITVKKPCIDALMEMITSLIHTVRAERLVIDSFTAVANTLSTVIEAHLMLHRLGNIVRQAGCTTLLVTETPTDLETISMGIEEFIVDGIIILKKKTRDGYTIRYLEIAKMRGTLIEEPELIFTLHEGFNVLTPLRIAQNQGPTQFTPTPNPPDHFSTWHGQLEEIFGGFRKGDTILVELGEGTAPFVPSLMFEALRASFMANGMGFLFGAPGGMNIDRIIGFGDRYGIAEEEHERLMRILFSGTEESVAPYILDVKLEDPQDPFKAWNEKKQQLMRTTGKPVLKIIYIDIIKEYFPLDFARRALEKEMALTKNEDSLLLLFSRSGSEELQQYASKMSDLHLRLLNERGVIIFHGIRPRTTLYAIENKFEGSSDLNLTPLI